MWEEVGMCLGSVWFLYDEIVVLDSFKYLREIDGGIGEGVEKLRGYLWVGSEGQVFNKYRGTTVRMRKTCGLRLLWGSGSIFRHLWQ